MTDAAAWVFVVDDDPSVRKALARLLRCAGLHAEIFPSAEAFLQYARPDAPGCLVLDVQMPELDGFGLQRSLKERHIALPIIFITGHGDIPMVVRALKGGAVDFLSKPVDDEDMLRAVRQAIAQDTLRREEQSDICAIRKRFESLSPRERQVLAHVVSGSLNKQIARRLNVTEKTVKVHRGQAMRKMEAGSLAELVRMAAKIGVHGPVDDPRATAKDRTLSLI